MELYAVDNSEPEFQREIFVTAQTDIIRQALFLLTKVNTEEYQNVVTGIVSSSIGRHMRHVIDHYYALMAARSDGMVDYDYRRRDSAIETCIDTARACFEEIIQWLKDLEQNDLTGEIQVSTQYSVTDSSKVTVASTLMRELLHVSSHTIHHLSVMSIICKAQNIVIPANFGVAPATLSYQQNHTTT